MRGVSIGIFSVFVVMQHRFRARGAARRVGYDAGWGGKKLRFWSTVWYLTPIGSLAIPMRHPREPLTSAIGEEPQARVLAAFGPLW